MNNLKLKITENKGQIMVITLLVLTIITIIVVSVILVVSKDVEQQTTTQEYEKYLDKAEQTIIDTIYSFDRPDYDFSELIADPSKAGDDAACSQLDKTITCTVVNPDDLSKVTMEISDTKDMEEYTLRKDQVYTMYLGGYNGIIRTNWTGETAMSFTLGFTRAGQSMTITDVFDSKGIMTSHGNDPLNDVAPGNHAFAFRPYLGDVVTSTEFLLSDTVGLQAGDVLVNLSFKPIMRESNGFSLLSVKVSGVIGDQLRVYKATAYASDVDQFGTTPAPTVVTKVPLYPQMPSLFDYVLLTDSFSK